MNSKGSEWITRYFDACAHDLTPSTERHAARVFYVPVSIDPGVTRNCSSVLSDIELQRADHFAALNDRALFIQRRAFRRFCGALVLGVSQPLSQVVFSETENGRPYLSALPNLWFSFSSCRFGFAGSWSWTHGIGVDCEDQTRKLETAELAHRFFSEAEARAVEGPGGEVSHRAFFKLWSLKEAALKSIGQGLPFGLDAFEFSLVPGLRVVHAPPDCGGPQKFRAHMTEWTESCIAMVIRSLPQLPNGETRKILW